MRSYLLLFFLFLSLNSIAQSVIYVKSDAGGTPNGSSWSNAFKSLQSALDAATPADEIWVAIGTYQPEKDPSGNTTPADVRDKTFFVPSGLKIYGGFAGTETDKAQRNPAYQSILDGDFQGNGIQAEYAYHVLLMVNASSNTILDGFLIRNGYANVYTDITVSTISVARSDGAGMNLYNSAPQLSNLTFEGNGAIDFAGGLYLNGGSNPNLTNVLFDSNSSSGSCGALYCSNSAISLSGVRFVNNSALYEAAAFSSQNSTVTISDCFFESNSCQFAAGAMNLKQTTGTISNSIVRLNSSVNGSGAVNINDASPVFQNLFFWRNNSKYGSGAFTIGPTGSSNPTLINTVFSENDSEFGAGAVRVSSGAASFTNCTFYKNESVYSAGAISNVISGLKLVNCLFFENIQNGSNTAPLCDLTNTSSATINVMNSLLQLANNTSNYPSANFPGLGSGANLFNQTPSFSNALDMDGPDDILLTSDDGLKVLSGSICINAGTATGAPVEDITGAAREGNPDIGAYEFSSSCPENLTPNGPISVNQKANISISSSGNNIIAASSMVSYQAGNYIQLNPGFSTGTNAVFMTKLLSGCQ